MRRLVLFFSVVFFTLFSTTACGSKSKGSPRLEGRWRGLRAEGVDPTVQLQANAFATATEIVAKGDQISITTPAAKSVTAKYSVEKDDKTSLVIRTDKDAATETFAFEDDPTQMKWRVDERKSIVFKKLEKQ
jgi:hypothetical protein